MEKDALFMSVIIIADDKEGLKPMYCNTKEAIIHCVTFFLEEKVPLEGHRLDDDDDT